MKHETLAAMVFVVLAAGFAGCDKDSPSPTAPTVTTVATSAPPAGGILINGTVFDTAFRPVARAVVEVLDGPQAGLSAIADARGGFSMTGVFDESTRFRATAEHHITSIRTLQPFCARCNPNWWIHFALEVPAPPVNIGGDYTLNFTANAACTMLPEDMRSRTFTATLPVTSPATRSNTFFRVGGATFFEDWDAISVGVAGNYVALWLETLVEQIAPNTFLAFAGQAAATLNTSNLSTLVLPFQGRIEHCVTTAAQGRYQDCYQSLATVRRCDSSHQVTLTRR